MYSCGSKDMRSKHEHSFLWNQLLIPALTSGIFKQVFLIGNDAPTAVTISHVRYAFIWSLTEMTLNFYWQILVKLASGLEHD